MELGVYELFIADEAVELDLDNIVPIGMDLFKEFAEQPSMYAYIATLAAQAEAAWLDARAAKKEMYAITDKEVRGDLEMSDVRVTEKLVETEVELRSGYREAIRYELDCREMYLIFSALSDAMKMRADMLISLGAHIRSELRQTDMTIKDANEEVIKKAKVALHKGKKVNRVLSTGEEDEDFDPVELGF